VGDRGPDQATPDIAAVIQEIVNQDGWASGNALVLIISDDSANPSQGIRCAEAGPGDDAALLSIEYTEAPPPPGANIAWVTETVDDDADGIQDDQAWIDWLEAEGHTVDVRRDYWLELDPNKVDELNAADLVIVSRGATSGGYDEGDEPALWNSVTSPLITLNCYLTRTNRWLWMDTTATEHADDILMAVDTTHPVFDGVTFEMGNMVIFLDNTVGTGLATFVGSTDVGNGTLIAQRLSADQAWIAEWAAGVEYFAGSGQIAGGPRMLFVAGTQEGDQLNPQGAWNLTAEGEIMFRNAIAYMLPEAEEPAPAPSLVAHWQLDEGAGTIAADSSGNGYDGTLIGEPNWVAGMIGGALEFDGVDDYVTITGYKGIAADRTDPNNPVQLAFSVACWINTADAEGRGGLVNWGSSDGAPVGGQYQNFHVHQGRLRAEHGNGRFRGATIVSDGQWHHVAMVVSEGANIEPPATQLYVDGLKDTEGEDTVNAQNIWNITAEADVGIGVRASHLNRFFNGMIDDARIYDYALSEAEVVALASGQ
jgi:hypothetical protein